MSDANSHAGEEVLWSGSVSHWHYAGRWLAVFLLAGAVVASFAAPFHERWLATNELHAYGLTENGLWLARGVLAAIGLALFVWIWVARARRKYVVTNKRVSVEFGILSKHSNEIRIDHIRSINLMTQGLSGLFGIGRIEFSSAATDDAEVIFWYVPRAERIRDMVRSLQTSERGQGEI
jgi:uncharacterized membrane protein YdbT with pleckstrin-like domain